LPGTQDRRNPRPFEEAVREHSGLVFSLACRLLGDRDAAEEVTQEVFLRAFRSWDRFRGDCAERTWFTRITVNTARNWKARWARRFRSRHQPLERGEGEGPSPLDRLPDGGADPERMARSREIQERVQKGLKTLPEEFREAVVLRDMEGMSYQEIAEALEITPGTVRSRIARGRAALREMLEDLV
jgi:RNA polymerase sigma-70 factor (ECF subfamily)